MATGLDILRTVATTGEGRPPVADLLGWEAIDLQPGEMRIRFTARKEFCNPIGSIQGGLLAAMLDDAMGPALFSLLDATSFAPTLELKVNFLRAVKPCSLIAEGRVVHRTKNIAFLEGRLLTEDGDLVATATATARIVEGMNA